mmetsp:Transcript_24039/g.27435  ORF Transcript_24039/g.27435 Transcript_24039/m.27435 type:complete len:318 (+) Transcript_24039:48-1001(+)
MKILQSLYLLALAANCANAFLASKTTPSLITREVLGVSSHSLQATATDAIASLEASQVNTLNKITAAIPDIAVKPELCWSSEAIAGSPATLDARDAPGPANVAWLVSVCVANQMSSLTIFNGPLTDVPHLLSRCIVSSDNTMNFALDFRPRAYGAYELPDSERGPDKLGRDSFTYSGNRKEYESKFATPEIQSFLQATAASFEGGTPMPTETSEYEILTKGPHFLKIKMPLTDANVAAVTAAREKAADYWLTWALEDSHAHRPGAPINSQYVYDSKYRQNAYLGLLADYNASFGADGPKIAAAESGPLDEGYVGGGS